MLPKSQRLSTKQFNEVLEKGCVAHTTFFLVRTLGGFNDRRVAAVMPKKIGKTAVARHKGTRKMYEATSVALEVFPPDTHSIVFAKKNIADIPVEELRSDIGKLKLSR